MVGPTDRQIQDQINLRIRGTEGVDENEIVVLSDRGEVHLSGTVIGEPAKRQVEKIAASVPGVAKVHNAIHVIHKTETD